MKSRTSLLTRFPSFSRLRRGAPERVLVHPMREWITCLIVGLLLGITLFGFASFDFYTQMTVVGNSLESEVSVSKYRADEAESIIRYYEGKETQFKTIREAGASMIPAPVTVGTGVVNGLEIDATSPIREVAGETE